MPVRTALRTQLAGASRHLFALAVRHLFAWALLCGLPLCAAHAVPVYLDTELDAWFNALMAPLKQTIPLTQPARVVLVPQESINAYVGGDHIIHVHSGLILQAGNAAEVQGVLAHELGHVSGRHVDGITRTANTSLLGGLAGAALGIGTAALGAPQAGAAIMLGSQAGALSNILAYSRTQESEADQRALHGLHQAGLAGKPLVTMLGRIRTSSQLSYDTPPPYLLSHPLPSLRMSDLTAATSAEATPTLTLPELSDVAFTRIRAKVYALSHTPTETLRKYPSASTPDAAYARVIAHARQGKLAEAETGINGLLATAPNDAFYLETKGQIALDQGRLPEAEQAFRTVLNRHPDYLFTRFYLAETLRALNRPADALPLFTAVTRTWPGWARPWQRLGLIYGQLSQTPQALAASHLSLAEAELARNDPKAARTQTGYARVYLNKLKNTPSQEKAANLPTPADLIDWAAQLTSRIDDTPIPPLPDQPGFAIRQPAASLLP